VAVSTGAAHDLAGALRLTPNQVFAFGVARRRMSGEGTSAPRLRRGTKDEFKAAILGAMG